VLLFSPPFSNLNAIDREDQVGHKLSSATCEYSFFQAYLQLHKSKPFVLRI
jgi:hypothetical protein